MIAFLNDFVDHRLMPSRKPSDEISRHRERLLAWVHLIAIVMSGLLFIVSLFVIPKHGVPVAITCIGSVALGHIYQRFGNLNLSANLLVSLLFAVLMVQMIPTGGLYSDNLLWMLLLPTVAFLFTSRNYGLMWSAIVVSVIVGLFLIEVNSSSKLRELTFGYDPSYYLVSYLGLFTLMIALVTLFVDGNKNLLEHLKQNSETLQSQKEELEAKNALLRKQEAELKRSNQDLELFASVASHDLKEPLRMINSYSQLLNKSLNDSMSERDREFLTYIKEGGIRMHTMLDDLLAYGKLGRDKKEEKPVDLEKSLLIVENNLKLRLQESGGRISWEALPTLLGHSTHFIQLFQNLIGNSLKFSREGVAPHVTIFSERQADHFVIQIVDNGLGIAEEDIDKVFGVFQRLSNQSKFEGSGLGLATVKRIMDGLDGSIEVTSTVGLGTTFTLLLPASRVVEFAYRKTPSSKNKSGLNLS